MRNTATRLLTAASTVILLGVSTVSGMANAGSHGGASMIEKGKALAFDRKLGNCLACHRMGEGDLPGNIGPPLIAMKARFPDKAKLRAQIYDATVRNPNSMMPPFGRHGALSDAQIDAITDYVYTL